MAAVKKFPKAPAHPERVCWGCNLYCPAKDMRCGNGSDRTQHPAELFGDDWDQWGLRLMKPWLRLPPLPRFRPSLEAWQRKHTQKVARS